ncbi:hypothetical protein JMJ77_0009479 [Colletotrichum scovillei]|uniref:Uncharacterized protein n=1 Tax=Colletotrichum scovillei TaxID=1209932 RepID=A0A9P7R249_9PEZI|nr:hypothetical protein JMJ77_0009479 [Colletotrichum scovillei]KAG7052559.1 hypothetical protein JMJ78_0005575 [Colletotrichum scovillei]KAG7064849.1 hypothetical protein JMJ76_0012607 [Colletotrichum scovillei]
MPLRIAYAVVLGCSG